MDPIITVIMAALKAALDNLSTVAIKDVYEALKTILKKKWIAVGLLAVLLCGVALMARPSSSTIVILNHPVENAEAPQDVTEGPPVPPDDRESKDPAPPPTITSEPPVGPSVPNDTTLNGTGPSISTIGLRPVKQAPRQPSPPVKHATRQPSPPVTPEPLRRSQPWKIEK